MKTKLLFFVLLLTINLPLLAQTQANNPILGTWKMTAQTIVDPDGKSMTTDMSKIQQYKMISPTHWMFVNYNSDSLKGGAEYGTYTLQGNKYVESLSWAKSDYTVKVDGSEFYQEGTLIYPDGKKWVLKEVYQKVAEPASANNPQLVGTWNMTSYVMIKDGKKESQTGISELQMNTPNHFMWVDKKDGEAIGAMFGSYKMEGDKVIPTTIIATFPVDPTDQLDITVTIKGDQMFTKGMMTKANGATETWQNVHQRVGKAKIPKVVSN